MTEEQELLLQRGEHAQLLLNDPVFNSVISEMVNGLAGDTFATDPKDWRSREANYYTSRALKGIVDDLRNRVTLAVSVTDQLELEQEAIASGEV